MPEEKKPARNGSERDASSGPPVILSLLIAVVLVGLVIVGPHLWEGEPSTEDVAGEPAAPAGALPGDLTPEQQADIRNARALLSSGPEDPSASLLLLARAVDARPAPKGPLLLALREDFLALARTLDPLAARELVPFLLRTVRSDDASASAALSGEAFRPVVEAMLSSDDPEVRIEGMRVLPAIDPDRARSRSADLLGDPAPSVRRIAVRVFASLAGTRDGPALRDLYLSESDAAVRLEILEALSDSRVLRPGIAREVERAALLSEDSTLQRQALRNLHRNRDHAPHEELSAVLRTGNRQVRLHALEVLQQLRIRKTIEAVQELAAADPDEEVRRRAARVLEVMR